MSFEKKRKITHAKDQEFVRYMPKGASRSNSPLLLANSFCIDFYELYKESEERKEKLEKGDSLADMIKRKKQRDEVQAKQEKAVDASTARK